MAHPWFLVGSAVCVLVVVYCLDVLVNTVRFWGIHRAFGLSPILWRITSADVGGRRGRSFSGLGAIGVVILGKPDLVASHRLFPRVIVADFKSAKGRDAPTPYEFFQMQLYIWLMRAEYPLRFVLARIVYRESAIDVRRHEPTIRSLISFSAAASYDSDKLRFSEPLQTATPIGRALRSHSSRVEG